MKKKDRAMTRCITFHRWRFNTGYSFMIGTDEEKIHLANVFYEDAADIATELMQRGSKIVRTTAPFQTPPRWRRCLTLYNPCDNTGIESVELVEHAMTFPFETEVDKLAFANWVIETKLERFVRDYMAVHLSTMYTMAEGFPVAEATLE